MIFVTLGHSVQCTRKNVNFIFGLMSDALKKIVATSVTACGCIWYDVAVVSHQNHGVTMKDCHRVRLHQSNCLSVLHHFDIT